MNAPELCSCASAAGAFLHQTHEERAQFFDEDGIVRTVMQERVGWHAGCDGVGWALNNADTAPRFYSEGAIRAIAIAAAQHYADDARSEHFRRSLKEAVHRWAGMLHLWPIVKTESA
jgi:hypothetical protein